MNSKQLEQVQQRVEAELERNPLWQRDVFGQWLCPYCGNLTEKTGEGAARAQAVLNHLVSACPSWNGFRGEYIPLKVLQNKSTSILISHSLSADAVWKVFDENGNWYCPFCTQAVMTKTGQSQEKTAELKAGIREHLHHCYKFGMGKGRAESLKNLRGMVDRANMIKRLTPRVRKMLIEDPRWQQMAVDGSWLCPFCQERIKNIDVSSELLRRETAPPPGGPAPAAVLPGLPEGPGARQGGQPAAARGPRAHHRADPQEARRDRARLLGRALHHRPAAPERRHAARRGPLVGRLARQRGGGREAVDG